MGATQDAVNHHKPRHETQTRQKKNPHRGPEKLTATKDDDIKEGVGAEAVGTMDRSARSLAGGVEAGHNLVAAVDVLNHLAAEVGGHTTHVVVHGGEDGDGLLCGVDAGKDGGRLDNAWQALLEDLLWQVGELQVHVVLVGAAATALADLDSGGAGDDVAGGKVLCGGGIALHEALALAVEEDTALTAAALCDEAAGTVDAGWVELHKLEVLVLETGAGDHGVAVAGASVGGGGGEVRAAVPTGGEHGVLAVEAVQGAVLLAHGQHTHAFTLVVHDEIQRKVLDKVGCVVAEGLAVEGVEQRMTRAVSNSAAAVGLAALAKLEALPAKRALVDLAFFRS